MSAEFSRTRSCAKSDSKARCWFILYPSTSWKITCLTWASFIISNLWPWKKYRGACGCRYPFWKTNQFLHWPSISKVLGHVCVTRFHRKICGFPQNWSDNWQWFGFNHWAFLHLLLLRAHLVVASWNSKQVWAYRFRPCIYIKWRT